MAGTPERAAPGGIAALPSTTIRQIGSGQVLVDPSSVVKELIDNALDARATSIFVEIAANTIDSIQVKDDGHGIPAEDRALVCRRFCTSKIRDLNDLRDIGGKWLGFRGEALASMAEMSWSLLVTTRVEGETVAGKLKYGRDGEILSTERDSHPVGTTVKSMHFFEHMPVRKQSAIKNSVKCLTKIHRIMQAYALARPAIRFRLHVLKAKNKKNDFIYAPKAMPDVEDAVMKTVSKDCALQCHPKLIEANGFEIRAFLPKPSADASKIASQGAFISIDSRPVSNRGGTAKQVINLFKDKLRKLNASFSTIKDPFCCMDIFCPPDSYDPNIEPAKDDVLFDNSETVLNAVVELLELSFPKVNCKSINPEPIMPTQQLPSNLIDAMPPESSKVTQSVTNVRDEDTEGLAHYSTSHQPQWRSSMYGFDEDDLQSMQENQLPRINPDEDIPDVTVSNPWTIARMNTTIKHNFTTSNGQLLSPAKSCTDIQPCPSSPTSHDMPRQTLPGEPLTPQASSKTNNTGPELDRELTRSIQCVPQLSPRVTDSTHSRNEVSNDIFTRGGDDILGTASTGLPRGSRAFMSSPMPATAHHGQASQNIHFTQPHKSSTQCLGGPFVSPTFGGSQYSPCRKAPRGKKGPAPPFMQDKSKNPPILDFVSPDTLDENGFTPRNNADIREFFGQRARASPAVGGTPSFTAINIPHQISQPRSQPRMIANEELLLQRDQRPTMYNGVLRASSAEPQLRPRHPREQIGNQRNYRDHEDPLDMASTFRDYAEMERPSSVGNILQSNVAQKSTNKTTALDIYGRKNELVPQGQVRNAARYIEPCAVLSGEDITSPRRRRTIDNLQRSKSSMLPLETPPHGCHVQDLSVPLPINLITIRHGIRRLDMSSNRTEWGLSPKAHKALIEPPDEQTITKWVDKLDEMLCQKHEPLQNSDTRCLLCKSIQSAFDVKRNSHEMGPEEPSNSPECVAQESITRIVDEEDPGPKIIQRLDTDQVDEFDMSQFLAFDIDGHDEDLNGGMDDEMLMDIQGHNEQKG